MIQQFCNWLLYKHLGWTNHVTVDHPDKFIICLAPHTSNWDFFIGQLYMRSQGMKINFLMKKEWFFWPLGPIFRKMGGIPVVRSQKTSLTDQIAEAAQRADYFNFAVTPEGTRKRTTKWRHGFYYIALKAKLPIQLYAIDGVDKKIICTKEIMPTGDFEADYREIMDYYRPYVGRAIKPDMFALDEV